MSQHFTSPSLRLVPSLIDFWKLFTSTVGVYLCVIEMSQIVALLVGTVSLAGALVVTCAWCAFLEFIGDVIHPGLRVNFHELADPPSGRVLAIDNSPAQSYVYTLISIYYRETCSGQRATNVTTNLVPEYDPATRHGAPYNDHLHSANPLSYLLGDLSAALVYISCKAVSVLLIKWKCQFF